MDRDHRMHIASISTTITTAAVLRLLEDTPGVAAVTFRNLLSHTSGFFFNGVASGETDDRETEAQFHARVFADYVQEVVFSPAGIPASRATTVPPTNGNRYYPWPYDELPGEEGTDSSLNYGAYGWYMSVVDLAAVLAYLRFTEQIISEESRAIMDSERPGWWNTRTGDHGTYTMKQGGWRWVSDPVEKGMQSIASNFSDGVQAVVIVNSRRDPSATDPALQPLDMASIMRDAFDNAFVAP